MPGRRSGSAGQVVLDDDLGFALGVVLRTYLRTANALMDDLPGGARGFQVLAAAARDLTCGQGVLAQRLGIDKTVMTYLVDDLERAGLVERCADPADRRNKRIVATVQGRATWERTQQRLRHAEEHVLGALDPDDRATFRQLLQRLAAQAQNLDPVDNRCQLVTDLGEASEAAANAS